MSRQEIAPYQSRTVGATARVLPRDNRLQSVAASMYRRLGKAMAIATIASLSLPLYVSGTANAQDVRLTSGVDGRVSVGVVSYRDIPFRTVVRQQFDFSCGSAALATLLTYHFERPTTEHEVFVSMYEMGDKEKINREGFSLFEMKQYLESLGYHADGFRVPLDKVARVGVPVIVLIEWQNYKHFVVLKGIQDGHVLIGDPARGLKVMDEDEFMKQWKDGIIFAIHNANDVGRRHYNLSDEWKGRPKSPLGTALRGGGLSVYNVMIPGGGGTNVF